MSHPVAMPIMWGNRWQWDMFESDKATPGTKLQVEILGEFYDAEVLGAPIYDANGANMRA